MEGGKYHGKRKSRSGSRLEGNRIRCGVPLGATTLARRWWAGYWIWRRFARWASYISNLLQNVSNKGPRPISLDL
jgi:hypothetical protein